MKNTGPIFGDEETLERVSSESPARRRDPSTCEEEKPRGEKGGETTMGCGEIVGNEVLGGGSKY